MYSLYIVTASEVKNYVPELNAEINDSLIDNGIKMVENTILMESLGQSLTDEIMSQKSGGTYSTANKYLVDNFLKELISYGVWQYISVTLSYQLVSSGLRIKNSDHSVTVESKDLAYYRSFIQNYIDRVRKIMSRYIEDHEADYPLYFANKYGDKPYKNIYNFKVGSTSR